jgi:hypothetical protein
LRIPSQVKLSLAAAMLERRRSAAVSEELIVGASKRVLMGVSPKKRPDDRPVVGRSSGQK